VRVAPHFMQMKPLDNCSPERDAHPGLNGSVLSSLSVTNSVDPLLSLLHSFHTKHTHISTKMESPSNKSHRPPAQTPPHRRILSGLTDPFVSKPTDPKPTVPPTMRLPKMAKHDLHLDLGSSVAGTTCESKVSQLHRRKKWQDEPQQHAAPRRPGEKDPEV
jgi:hypothetical protein